MDSQTKLKHIRDYKENCKEVEDDLKWFLFRIWPAMMAGIVFLIYSVAYFSEQIDNFFKSMMP